MSESFTLRQLANALRETDRFLDLSKAPDTNLTELTEEVMAEARLKKAAEGK